jgi:hypothetical protein
MIKWCRVRLEEMDRYLLRGRYILANLGPPLLAAAVGGHRAGLKAFEREADSMTRNPAQIEAEVSC